MHADKNLCFFVLSPQCHDSVIVNNQDIGNRGLSVNLGSEGHCKNFIDKNTHIHTVTRMYVVQPSDHYFLFSMKSNSLSC
jgi:hypothetical protein